MATRKEYLNTIRKRYLEAKNRKEKSVIINEVVNNLQVHRKHAIRTVNHPIKTKRLFNKTRPEVYTYDLKRPLIQIWEVAGYPCSKRLRPQIPELLRKLKQFDEIKLYERQEYLLCRMSTYIIDNFLREARKKTKGKGLSGTKRSPLLKSLIPIRTNFDEIDSPGHIEMDCLLHCGTSVAGRYAETLNMLDIHTHWNELIAFVNKTDVKIIGSLHVARKYFPFDIKSIDFDNGVEFINKKLIGYCQRENIEFTRSRPYRKNDQAYVEGKNFQSIRKLIGYDRIESEEITDILNDIYRNEHRLLTNFFYTTLKLKIKRRVGSKIVKKYYKAKTPYHRLLDSKLITKGKKDELRNIYKGLNPAQLQRDLKLKMDRIEELISVTKINLATPMKKNQKSNI